MFFVTLANAQHWQCNIHEYQYDMTVYAVLEIAGKDVEASGDMELAAFCNDECRGVASVETANGQAYYYLRVRSNVTEGETITFKCFDATTQEEMEFATSVGFKSQQRYGYPSEPLVLTYIAPTFNVSASSSDANMGSVIIEGGGDNVEYGTEIKVTAIPAEGYDFVNWTVGDTEKSTENPYIFTVSEDISLIGNFTAKTYKVTYIIDGEVYKVVEVKFGEVIPQEETPVKEGYTFSGWTEIPETMPAHDIEIVGAFNIVTGMEEVMVPARLKAVFTLDGKKAAKVMSGNVYIFQYEDGRKVKRMVQTAFVAK